MAARSRCDERFFRIDRSRNRMWKRYTRRSRGRQYFNASVEAPDMTAAVFVVKEGNALPFPFNRRAIFMRHIQSPLSGLSDLTLRAASAAKYLSSARPAIPQALCTVRIHHFSRRHLAVCRRAQIPAQSTSHKCEPWLFVISPISSRSVASHQRRPS